MIAKAATISHGSNAIRYSVNKDRADIVKTNLLPDDISPEAMFKRMMLVQKMFANERKRGRPLTDNVIRIERFAIRCRSTSGCKEWHSPPAH